MVGPKAEPTAGLSAPAGTSFEGTHNACWGRLLERRVTPRGVVLLTVENENQWLTDNPLVSGIEENRVEIAIAPDGSGMAQGLGTLQPDGIEGYWKIRFRIQIGGPENGVATGFGNARGELRGLRLRFENRPFEGVSACDGSPRVGLLSGFVFGHDSDSMTQVKND